MPVSHINMYSHSRTYSEKIFSKWTWNNGLVPNWERSITRLYIVTLLITYMQGTSWETLGWKKHKLESRLKWSEVAQSCPTLGDPMDCSLPGSSVHGIFQAIVLEWIAISFSRGSSQPRDRTQVSHIVDRHFTVWATKIAGRNINNLRYVPPLWQKVKRN